MSRTVNIEEKLKKLRLNTIAEKLGFALEEEKKKNKGTAGVLEYLLDLEIAARQERAIMSRFRQSKLYEKHTIDQFDFNFHPSRKKNRATIMNLLDLNFITDKKDVIFIGNPGVGKSMLAKTTGYQACLENTRVLFTKAIDMINHLTAAEADHSLLKKLHYYQSPDLLVCDELGYLPLNQHSSNLLFQVISARHGKASTMITTNMPFGDWGKIFDSATVAVAIADRLVENSEVIIMEGPSYRKRGNKGNNRPKK